MVGPRPRAVLAAIALNASLVLAPTVADAQVHRYKFAYDQPKMTGYGIAGDVFAAKLRELSKGTMLVDQYPDAQLGQEPQVLQLVRVGDIDFCISSSANAAALSPEAGVMSLHYLFRSEDHLRRAITSVEVDKAVRDLFEETVRGSHVLALATLGLRSLYAKREVRKFGDIRGWKVRIQATPTDDTMFPAYGAQTVHMPFGSVYAALQTGTIDAAENGINVYFADKHYEVAPVLSLTEHEANNSLLWVSDRLWSSLSDEQKSWVQAAANEVARVEPAEALELEHRSVAALERLGVRIVNVDKSGFIDIARPYRERMAHALGPHAEKIQKLVSAIH